MRKPLTAEKPWAIYLAGKGLGAELMERLRQIPLIGRWLNRRVMKASSEPISTGRRLVYAVGDIHGQHELLLEMLRLIEADFASTSPEMFDGMPVLIFLGDYVDRGPASAQVVDTVSRLLHSASHFEVRALKGNHEEAVQVFMGDSNFGAAWASHGGAATLASYGISAPTSAAGPKQSVGWEEARLHFVEKLSDLHVTFYSNLELMIQIGSYVFVHAGVRPGVSLERQKPEDLLWIREPFLTSERPSQQIIVHGHTPEREPYIGAHRIGLDTGAYATGILSAARILDAEVSILQAGRVSQ